MMCRWISSVSALFYLRCSSDNILSIILSKSVSSTTTNPVHFLTCYPFVAMAIAMAIVVTKSKPSFPPNREGTPWEGKEEEMASIFGRVDPSMLFL